MTEITRTKLIQKIKLYIKTIMPSFVLNKYKEIKAHKTLTKENRLIALTQLKHEEALDRIKKKEGPINVVFMALLDSVWKYDRIYRLMEEDSRFHPIILVCPVVNSGRNDMLKKLYNCYNTFKNLGYNVLLSYDIKNDSYIDIKKTLNPDIIFYANPYKGLIDDRYYITEFPDILTCYTNYFFQEDKIGEISCNSLFHNLLWKKYIETEFHKTLNIKFQRIQGRNLVVTGYPGIDNLIDKKFVAKDVWKIKDKNIIRIIWAPHHTIDNSNFIQYGTFLKFAENIIQFARKYRDKIQIAFKPHPMLINRLYLVWGKEKTDNYYSQWREMKNGMLCEGPYQDLFLTSDAIMHDSGSFLFEYLFTGKPALHLDNEISYETQYNTLAIEALKYYYHASCEKDIENFIKILLDRKDPIGFERNQFVKDNLMPPNDKLASENIMKDLIQSLEL